MSGPAWIVGAGGRVGAALAAAALRPAPVGLRRAEVAAALDGPGAGEPVVFCGRNDDLGPFLDGLHPGRLATLCLVQNPSVAGVLGARGLDGRLTEAVLWAAFPAVGAAPVPGGPSPVCGPAAAGLAALLAAAGVEVAVVSRASLAHEQAVKLAWLHVFGLLGSARGGTVGERLTADGPLVGALAAEAAPVLADAFGLRGGAAALDERLRAYTARVPFFRASAKEWPYRSGALFSAAAAQGRALPAAAALAAEAGLGAPA